MSAAARRALGGCCAAAAAAHLRRRRRGAAGGLQAESSESWHAGYRWFAREPAGPGRGAGELRGPRWPGPAGRGGERMLTRAEVGARDGRGEGGEVWVTYRDGVYDVTRYLAEEHPGGRLLLQAAGGPVEGFWAHWAQHHMSPEVPRALERLRIGRLVDFRLDEEEEEERYGGGAWAEEQADPCRAENRARASPLSQMPYQSETRSAELASSYLTSSGAFYVRNHAPVPHVPPEEASEHAITLCVGEDEVAALTLAELQARFGSASVVSVMQCAGNRAADNIAANGVHASGFVGGAAEHLGLGMLGNARWRGARLADVLRELLPPRAGAEADDLHVTFEGLDGYYTSAPLRHVMDPSSDCLLAVEMNSAPLAPDHGFPVRALLPGVAGARSVKWLSKITVGGQTDSPWTRHYYRDRPSLEPVQLLPMNSVILSPEPGAYAPAEARAVVVRGVAYAGGSGRAVAGVEVSADRGQSWHAAACLHGEVPADDSSAPRGWVRFEGRAPLPHAGGGAALGVPQTELWCRAVDDRGGVQPDVGDPHGGYLYNGYHRVPLLRGRLPAPAQVVL